MTPYQIHRSIRKTLSDVLAITEEGDGMTDLLDLIFDDILTDGHAAFAERNTMRYHERWYAVADDFADIADAIERSGAAWTLG